MDFTPNSVINLSDWAAEMIRISQEEPEDEFRVPIESWMRHPCLLIHADMARYLDYRQSTAGNLMIATPLDLQACI